MNKLRQRVDPRRYNGAVFIGLNGIAVKSHGGADAVGFANAIGVAVDLLQHNFIEETRAACDAMQNSMTETPAPVQ